LTEIKDPQTMFVLPTSFEVASESDASKTYDVQLPGCKCKDSRYRRAKVYRRIAAGEDVLVSDLFCKHQMTAARTLGGWHDPDNAPWRPWLPVGCRTDSLAQGVARAILVDVYKYDLTNDEANRLMLAARELGSARMSARCLVLYYDRSNARYTIEGC
jgi:hypothetical protein